MGERKQIMALALKYLRQKYPELNVKQKNLSFGKIDTHKGVGEVYLDIEEKPVVEDLPEDIGGTDFEIEEE